MKRLIIVVFAFFYFASVAAAQDSFTAHGSTVIYARPDPAQWNLVHNGMDAKANAFLLMFEHSPIKDAQGREIKPVIAAICEAVTDSSDVIMYSIRKRAQVPFDVKKVLTPQGGDFTHRNAVGFDGLYDRGVVHKVVVGHLRHQGVGVQVICDSTDGVHDKVEADMRGFMRSITFKE
jgi:hypothetical protein